jgi:hypothetical protein
MPKSKGWAALAAVVSVAFTALVAPAALAAPTADTNPDPNLTITSVTLGRTSVAVASLNLVQVPVTVAAKYVTAQPDPRYLNVFLKRTGGTGPALVMTAARLPLVSGTLADGVWKGTLYVPSTANGTFKVIGVLEGYIIDGSTGGSYTETLFDGPSIAVTGSHLPKFSVSMIPKAVPIGSPYKVRVTVYDSATGKPYGTRIRIGAAWEVYCMENRGGGLSNTAGVVELTFPADAAYYTNCAWLSSPGSDILSLNWSVVRLVKIAAAPSKTSAPVGTIVPVNGTVNGPVSGCPVELQRLRGATQWRGVSEDSVRRSGRFTVLAQPPTVGNVVYRASFPKCQNFQAVVSKSFVIHGS